jgi:curli production assembly/transport component CsgF
MSMKKLLITAIILLAFFHVAVRAQDFVYQPINPAFGGNPYNYSWMLAQAQAQNDFTEDNAYAYQQEDPLASLQNDINRQVLQSLTQQFYQNQFGENGLTEGYYKFGSYEIDVSPVSEGMQVRIIDIYTGSETTIIIPYY